MNNQLEQLYYEKCRLAEELEAILSLITEHASRYSTGSQGRVALETLALEIRERS